MQREGPPLEQVLQRISVTPPDFMAEPRIGDRGEVQVLAVIRDLLAAKGQHSINAAALQFLGGRDGRRHRNHLSIVLLLSWLLADEALPIDRQQLSAVLGLLREDAEQLAAYTNANSLFDDAERREELARLTLARLGLRPAGESELQAQDRFTSISSLERARLLRASQQAEQRARAIREALAKKAADEAADKWTRE
jgi:hypothetical protein